MQRMIAAPQRFEFVQALHIIGLWLRRSGAPSGRVLIDHVRIKQSLSLSFPASEIEALTLDAAARDLLADGPVAASQPAQTPHVYLTPTFMGLLGVNGILPHHYTETIGACVHTNKDEGPRAFLDTFATPALMLFFQAWSKYRLHYRLENDGSDGWLPLQLALAGAAPNLRNSNPRSGESMVCDETAGFYAAVLRHRAVSHSALAAVLAEYFQAPISVEQFVGQWDYLPPAERCALGVANRTLGRNAMLGLREWRFDLCVRLRIGPLASADYRRFLPQASGARALKTLLSLFPTPGLQFEVQLILQAVAAKSARLAALPPVGSLGLGQGSFLAGDLDTEREGMRYRLRF